MRHLIHLLLYCFLPTVLCGQTVPEKQQFVIKKVRIIDYENLYTQDEIIKLNHIADDCWKNGIADIAIVTIDEHHTDKAHFDQYVSNHLTGYAQGAYEKNNGIVIVISKQLRQMRIQNGKGITKIISDDDAKKIIDEQFVPKFREGNYFEGTYNGLSAIISHVKKEMQEYNYTDASSIFRPSLFQKIRRFVLENGVPQTFRNLDSDNPCYNFTSLDVFLGPSKKDAFISKDFSETDYYEMTVRNSDGSHYQFICFDAQMPEQTFLKKIMHPDKVYWLDPGDKLISQDVWPLLMQIEDEIRQNAAADAPKNFTGHRWILKQEFDHMEQIYKDIDTHDTLAFDKNDLLINGHMAGTFEIDETKKLLSLRLEKTKRPSFTIFKMEDHYYYRFYFNKTERKLYLLPLDEKEGNDLISVEGCTLVGEILEP